MSSTETPFDHTRTEPEEVVDSNRFRFGENWSFFLKHIDDHVIEQARQSLRETLGMADADGRTFLDAGSGSGLFSLAARTLGATVRSFDFDPESVDCAQELKRRYYNEDDQWSIERGSLLHEQFLNQLDRFDVVYCWGVIHHTGDMWLALDQLIKLVAADGLLCVSTYNDQGRASIRWTKIKRLYNRLPRPARFLLLWAALLRIWGPTTLRDVLRGQPFHTWKNYNRENRGMSPWRDLVDWVGGYPFEVSRPEEVIQFCLERGMELRHLKTCGGGRGCNEFVFHKRNGESA